MMRAKPLICASTLHCIKSSVFYNIICMLGSLITGLVLFINQIAIIIPYRHYNLIKADCKNIKIELYSLSAYLHVRSWLLTPPPHDLEQSDHVLHVLQTARLVFFLGTFPGLVVVEISARGGGGGGEED